MSYAVTTCTNCERNAEVALCEKHMEQKLEGAYQSGRAVGYEEGFSSGQNAALMKD